MHFASKLLGLASLSTMVGFSVEEWYQMEYRFVHKFIMPITPAFVYIRLVKECLPVSGIDDMTSPFPIWTLVLPHKHTFFFGAFNLKNRIWDMTTSLWRSHSQCTIIPRIHYISIWSTTRNSSIVYLGSSWQQNSFNEVVLTWRSFCLTWSHNCRHQDAKILRWPGLASLIIFFFFF